MTWHSKDAGVWQEISEPSTKVSGVWEPIVEAYVKVAGVWELFYTAVVAAVVNVGSQTDGFTYTASGYGNGTGVYPALNAGTRTPTSFAGANIAALYSTVYTGPLATFTVVLTGTHAQSFFTSVAVQDYGPLLLTASATFTQSGGTTSWEWSIGTVSPWFGDNGLNRTATISK